MSLPSPPSSTSSPRMPRRMSSPPRPIRRSFERVPSSWSGPSVPVKTARPGWTTSPPGRPETFTVFSRVPVAAASTETVRRAVSLT